MADPVALLYFLNVHELDANISLVGVFVGLNQVSELPFVRLGSDRSVEWDFESKSLVEVSFGESMSSVVEQMKDFFSWESKLFGHAWYVSVVVLEIERVQVCAKMSVRHECAA